MSTNPCFYDRDRARYVYMRTHESKHWASTKGASMHKMSEFSEGIYHYRVVHVQRGLRECHIDYNGKDRGRGLEGRGDNLTEDSLRGRTERP
eukprot:1343161-Amorphochlora_amoeboformis.AAC.1